MFRAALVKKVLVRGRLILLTIVLLASTWPPAVASALTQDSGFAIYAESAQNTPRWRQWKALSSQFSGELSLPTASDVPRQVKVRTAPNREEAIAGTVNVNGLLTMYGFNGYTWSTEWTTSVSGCPGSLTRFGIAYEQSSGEALVVYSRNTTGSAEMGYRIWNGSSWTSEITLDAVRTSGTMTGITLAARPGANDLALAWIDGQFDASARWWDGTNNTWQAEPLTALTTDISRQGGSANANMKALVPIFEASSGDLLIAWGDEGINDLKYITRSAGSGGSWGAISTDTTFSSQPTDIDMASEPGTSFIVLSTAYNGVQIEGVIWNGSAWANHSVLDTSINPTGAGTSNLSTSWLTAGAFSKAVVTYDDLDSPGVDWITFNKGSSTWTVETDYTATPTPVGLNDKMHQSARNPFNTSETTVLVDDANEMLYAKRATMSANAGVITWSSLEGGSVLESSLANANGTFIADFAYAAFVNAPALSVFIVNPLNEIIASPAVTFTPKASSNICQTSTGSIGTNDQRIRIGNTTSTPGWSLSLAATNGTNSVWSSGTHSYDYNDNANLGCGDTVSLGDPDTVGGQLSVDPSGSVLTVDPTCTTNNITKGSSAKYIAGPVGQVASITLLSANSSADVDCYWYQLAVSLSQAIPAYTFPGDYNLPMTLTTVAN